MSTYRPGGHWRVTIVDEGTQPADDTGHRPDARLRAVVMDGKVLTTDPELAELVCELLNEAERLAGLKRDVMEHLMPPRPAIEHHPQSPGGDGLGYGPCTGCGELWPCMASRGAKP